MDIMENLEPVTPIHSLILSLNVIYIIIVKCKVSTEFPI